MGYRRDVHRGAVCTGSASGTGGRTERTASGAGVWDLARDRSQDVAVFGSARVSPAAAGEAAEAGAWVGMIDAILERG